MSESKPDSAPEPETVPPVSPETPVFPRLNLAMPSFFAGGDETRDRDERIVAMLSTIQGQLAETTARLAMVERRQADVFARVDQLGYYTQQGMDGLGRLLDSIRTGAPGSSDTQLLRHVFHALVEPLDILAAISVVLDPKDDCRTLAQFRAVMSGLSTALDALGFERFSPLAGDPFDPRTMECIGYASGQPGTVTEVKSAGYHLKTMIVRPAQVLIPDPRTLRDTAGMQSNEERTI